MKIYLVAFFKWYNHNPEDGFMRCDLQTFYTGLTEARKSAECYFCDEAGFYEGVLIEEREEGNPMFHGERIWYWMDPVDNQMKEIPEPEYLHNVTNVIE